VYIMPFSVARVPGGSCLVQIVLVISVWVHIVQMAIVQRCKLFKEAIFLGNNLFFCSFLE